MLASPNRLLLVVKKERSIYYLFFLCGKSLIKFRICLKAMQKRVFIKQSLLLFVDVEANALRR